LSGNQIFKIGPSNICWEAKFSKSDDLTFVGNENLQNPPIQRLLWSKICKIHRSNICGGAKFAKSADPTFVGQETGYGRVVFECKKGEFWVS